MGRIGVRLAPMSLTRHERGHLTQTAASISLAVALAIIAMQLFAYFQTNAMVMLASVLESVADAVASGMSLFALHAAHRGPDYNHRYGHGKAEPLVALAQAAFIAGSGIYFLLQAANRLINPQPVESATFGIVIMLASSALILGLLMYQHRIVRRTHSMSIKADFVHYMNDLVVNFVVIAALVMCRWSGWQWVDSASGILIAGYILCSAYPLGRRAANELMDLEMDDAARQRILKIIRANSAVSGVHDLRTRRSGPDVFIEAHVEMPPQMTLTEVHHVTDELEAALRKKFPTAYITLHQEPAGIQDHRLDKIIGAEG